MLFRSVDAYAVALATIGGAERFGPVLIGDETWRLTARAELDLTPALLAALRQESGTRSAAKLPGVRVRVDPQVID